MKHASQLVIALFAAGLAIAGCARGQGPSTGEAVGGAAGAVAGGLAGSQIGSGSGRLIATGTGAVLGALVGSQLGKYLTQGDERRITRTTGEALENNKTGETSTWENPDTGHRGRVTPTETYQRSDGTYCREYQHTIYIDGQPKEAYGTACRQPDGSWKIVET